MIVYRLVRKKWANDLSGEGARLYGGRWNHVGTPCLYTSESRSLAVLEYTVNINIDDIPLSLKLVTIEIPDNAIGTIAANQLPPNWNTSPVPAAARTFGTNLLKTNADLTFRMPSVIIPREFNYVINPLHRRKSEIKIIDIEDFVYDARIKQ